jgi:hypothetical protein
VNRGSLGVCDSHEESDGSPDGLGELEHRPDGHDKETEINPGDQGGFEGDPGGCGGIEGSRGGLDGSQGGFNAGCGGFAGGQGGFEGSREGCREGQGGQGGSSGPRGVHKGGGGGFESSHGVINGVRGGFKVGQGGFERVQVGSDRRQRGEKLSVCNRVIYNIRDSLLKVCKFEILNTKFVMAFIRVFSAWLYRGC